MYDDFDLYGGARIFHGTCVYYGPKEKVSIVYNGLNKLLRNCETFNEYMDYEECYDRVGFSAILRQFFRGKDAFKYFDEFDLYEPEEADGFVSAIISYDIMPDNKNAKLVFAYWTEEGLANWLTGLGKKYGLECYYSILNENTGDFCTNDAEGKFFPERYVYCTVIKNELTVEYFNTFEDLASFLKENHDVTVSNMQDVEDFAKSFDTDNFGDLVWIDKLDIIKD